MEIYFCVIMPCYNSSAYVRDAIDSLLAQSYPHWKLIAVNDGSKDDTLNVLNGYSQKDSRITVYSKENGGYVSAVNMGLEKVAGDYFLLMGSDDQLAPTLFMDLQKHITKELPDMIAFRAVKVKDGKIFSKDPDSDFDSFSEMYQTTIREYEKSYPSQSRILLIRDTAKCFKTSKLGDLRYFGKYGFDADGIFSILFAHKCSSFMSIPIDGYLWTIRSDSLSAKTNEIIEIDRLNNWIEYYKYIEQLDINEIAEFEKQYVNCLNVIGLSLILKAKKYSKDINGLVNTARYLYLDAVKKYDLQVKKRILESMFKKTPTLWNYLYRFIKKREK